MSRPGVSIFVALLAPLAAQQAPSPQPQPSEPRERRQSNYRYDASGRAVPGEPAVREERRGGVIERQESIRGASGQAVTTRSSQERVLSEQGENRATERVIHRYDPDGRPTTRQMVRTETRRQADGSLVKVESLWEQDVNGRMQFTERRTTTEAKTATGGTASIVVERPAFSGSLEVVERTDRTDAKKSDAVTESVSSTRRREANGRLEERQRESSVATKSGEVTTRETQQWEYNVGGTGKMDFTGRTSSRLTEQPDGSQVEDLEVYTTRIADTTPDLNRPGVPTLEQQVRREKKVQPDGKIVETTSARVRQVAEPARLRGLLVTEQVTTPGAEGQTVETKVSERDANGRLQLVRRMVEEQKK